MHENEGDGTGAEGEISESTGSEEVVPAGGSEGGPAPAAPAGGEMPEWARSMAEENRQFREHYSRTAQEAKQREEMLTKKYEEARDYALKTWDPEGYKARQQPQYMTQADFQKALADRDREYSLREIRREFHSSLPTVKEKFPALAEYYGEDLEVTLQRRWIAAEKEGKSAVDVARELNSVIEAKSKAREAKKEADVLANKGAMKGTLRGTGSPGKAPDTSKVDSGVRGRGRILNIMRRSGGEE